MKLLFDARYVRTDYHDGISRYSVELGSALAKLTAVSFLISDDRQKKWFPKGSKFIKIHAATSIKEPFTALILNKYKPDVVYSPMQMIGTWGRKYVSVLTLHDMIYYRHPKAPKSLPLFVRIGWWFYHQTYLPQKILLKGADILTTVSETSAKDIKNAKITKLPITIVYNAPQKFTKYPVKHKGEVKNIVYMGSFMSYKNVETLIKGMKFLPGRTLHILSRISPARLSQLEKIIPKNSLVKFHNGVSDDEYEKILANNAVLATASLDEGYGIPVAEAMSMGVPVAISDIPVFREVGANGATYFKPRSPRGFAEAVKKLDNPAYRKQQIALSKAHIAKFNWETSAKVLLSATKGRL